jgi:FMN reductase (NADPH)
MIDNPVVRTLMNRKSIRKYRPDVPSDEVVETVVRSGQQAPFAYQTGSLLLSRDPAINPFGAPLCFVVLVDVNRTERVMAARGWERRSSDLDTLLFGIQDAAYMAQNMVIAAESLGMGSCYIGAAPWMAGKLSEERSMPARVFPLVMLAMGYPDEDPPVRPRYPLEFSLHGEVYREPDDVALEGAMETMDRGYLEQDYYRRAGFMVELPEGVPETFTFDDYSWTEHISRKLGLWGTDPGRLQGILRDCGFDICPSGPADGEGE